MSFDISRYCSSKNSLRTLKSEIKPVVRHFRKIDHEKYLQDNIEKCTTDSREIEY